MEINTQQSNGFALLLTLIIVSVILAIGLSLLNITLKQFTLSTTARDSEIAFHAANTGIECMDYYRDDPTTRPDLLDGGAAPALTCAGTGATYSATNHASLGDNRYVYNYEYRYSLSGGRCTETSIYFLDTRSSSSAISDYTVNEGFDTLSCSEGVICTTIFSRGFNRSCDSLDSIRTVQRELTIQY